MRIQVGTEPRGHGKTTRALSLATAIAAALVTTIPTPALGQEQASLLSALDSLLNIPVSTASKFDQTSREAAASVTVITSEEIRRQGFLTVADALETVPGFYFTHNRTHQSIGVRAFTAFEGDNKTVLVLLDGHSLNDNFFDGAKVGTALSFDLRLIDRIEVVHGPGSALYGSNAMLAVVNLITKTGLDIDGLEVSGETGAFGLRKGSFLLGRELPSGLDVTLSGVWSSAEGSDVYFPEWDRRGVNGGVAEGVDWDEGNGLHGSVRFRDWKLVGFFSERDKGTPTAPFGSDFGSPDARTTDERFFGEISVDRDLGPDKNAFARAYIDGAMYDVTYPFQATGDIVGGLRGRWLGAEGRFRWDPHPAQRITIGGEVRRHQRAEVYGQLPVLGDVSGNFQSTVTSGFAQVDLQLHDLLGLTAGARVDHYTTVGAAVSPRGGLVAHLTPATTLKALYGEAFRAPNQPELNLEGPPIIRRNPDIEPERIRTFELVWEQRISRAIHATLAGYKYRISQLIGATADPSGTLFFDNLGSQSVTGFEMSLDAKPIRALSLRAGYAFQNPGDDDAQQFTNVPRHSVKASAGLTVRDAAELGLTSVYDSGREGRLGSRGTDAVLITDAAVTIIGVAPIRVSLVGKNVFDVAYSHPAAADYFQDVQPQTEGPSDSAST